MVSQFSFRFDENLVNIKANRPSFLSCLKLCHRDRTKFFRDAQNSFHRLLLVTYCEIFGAQKKNVSSALLNKYFFVQRSISRSVLPICWKKLIKHTFSSEIVDEERRQKFFTPVSRLLQDDLTTLQNENLGNRKVEEIPKEKQIFVNFFNLKLFESF